VPLIRTWSPGFGAAGTNESMTIRTVGTSAAGSALAGGVDRAPAVDAAIRRPAAESLSRRLNTRSP
jgi:hypothetical protein